jgi:hypothetical protein
MDQQHEEPARRDARRAFLKRAGVAAMAAPPVASVILSAASKPAAAQGRYDGAPVSGGGEGKGKGKGRGRGRGRGR